jgi:hypothetical protein
MDMDTGNAGTPQDAVSDEEAAAAADDLAAAIAHQRDLHRQADTKAVGAFAAVALVIAAGSTLLPRLDGKPFVAVVVSLVAVALAGLYLGLVLIPWNAVPHGRRTGEEAKQHALRRARHPHNRLTEHANELAVLEDITRSKHLGIRLGLLAVAVSFLLLVSVIPFTS